MDESGRDDSVCDVKVFLLADLEWSTIGVHFIRYVRCLAAIARRVSTPELIELIASIDATWHPDAILFESNAAFQGIAAIMTQQASFGAKIKPIAQTKDKASRVAAFLYTQPVVATLMGWAFLGEQLTVSLGISTALVLLGLWVVERGR